MTAPIPQRLSDLLRQRMQRVLSSGRLDTLTEIEKRSILREADDVAKTDVIEADRTRVALALMAGDYKEINRRLKNIEQNGRPDVAAFDRLWVAVNLVRGTDAFAAAPRITPQESWRPVSEVVQTLVCIGAFRSAASLIDEANRVGLVTQGVPEMQLARNGAAVLDEAGISDQFVAATLDVVGDLLREQNLFWLGDKITAWVSTPGRGDPSVLLQYPIRVSPAEAAELNWTLGERLAERDLVHLGLAVGFVGCLIEEPAEAA